MDVLCKVQCISVLDTPSGRQYSFTGVYDSEENRKFWEATPSLSLSMSVNKDKVPQQLFETGAHYFVTLSPAQ